jgi:metallo-beta-lactamase family protein
MQVIFHGATRTVTGSLHELRAGGQRILLDCGFFQGPRAEARRINATFDFDPAKVDAVILSHGHTDHCGNLPNLVKQGFSGPIYATRATAALTALMLMDSAKIQEEDAAYLSRKNHNPDHDPVEPLYTTDDAQRTMELFKELSYRQPRDIGGIAVEMRDAGHILGSAAVCVTENQTGRKLVFTGDVGRPDAPVVRDPDSFKDAHVLISECTYGGRQHPPIAEVPDLLAKIAHDTAARGGWLLIPAFALGRTQALVEILHLLRDDRRLPRTLPIFVDSPLASRLTEVFRHAHAMWDAEAKELARPFDFTDLHYVASADESRQLNQRPGPGIIIASSGMCEGGRIVHHLKHHIRDRKTTILLPGFQAAGTLGRAIQNRERVVEVLGAHIPLNAHVEMLHGLSAHADGPELIDFVRPMAGGGTKVFLVHGELDQAEAHQKALAAAGFADVKIPQRGDSVEV